MNEKKQNANLNVSGNYSCLAIIAAVLIIVVIVIFIAVQRYVPFNTRGRVSRVKSDHRSLALAIEAYYVDHNAYPAMAVGAQGANARFAKGNPGAYRICTFRLRGNTQLETLTTPTAYITSYNNEYFSDPFADTEGSHFGYRQYQFTWLLISYGPDRDENTTVGDHFNTVPSTKLTSGGLDLNFEPSFNINVSQPSSLYMGSIGKKGTALHYDPSNGTISEGDIVRVRN